MSPDDTFNAALLALLRGDADQSEALVRGCIESTPHLDYLLGWHEMRRGRMSIGEGLRERGRLVGFHGQHHPIPLPQYKAGQALAGKRLALDLEGGLGDQMAYVRFARVFHEAGAEVTIIASRPLHTLLARVEGVARVVDRQDMLSFKDADFWIPAMRAPSVLGLEWDTLPLGYLNAKDAVVRRWDRWLGRGPRIGLRWSGGPNYTYENLRRFDPGALAPLARMGRVFALHREPAGEPCPLWATELCGELTDWEETAGLITCMNVVISCETSVCVLAAMLGVPTFILVPSTPTHYFMYPWRQSTTPWFRFARLFHAERSLGLEATDWPPVLQRVLKAVPEVLSCA